jgi:hypothetical protein
MGLFDDIFGPYLQIIGASTRHDITLDFDGQCIGVDDRKFCLTSEEPIEYQQVLSAFGNIAEIADFVGRLPGSPVDSIYVGTPEKLVEFAEKYHPACSGLARRLFVETDQASGLWCDRGDAIFARNNKDSGKTIKHELGHAILDADGKLRYSFFDDIFWRYAYLSFKAAGIPEGDDLNFLMSTVLDPQLSEEMSCEDKHWFRNLWNEYKLDKYFPTTHGTSNFHEFFATIVEEYRSGHDYGKDPPFYAGFFKALDSFCEHGAGGFFAEVERQYPMLMQVKPDAVHYERRAEAEYVQSSDTSSMDMAGIWALKGAALAYTPFLIREARDMVDIARGTNGKTYHAIRSGMRERFRGMLCLPAISEAKPSRTTLKWISRAAGIASAAGLTALFWKDEVETFNVECGMPLAWENNDVTGIQMTRLLASIAGLLCGGVVGGIGARFLSSMLVRRLIANPVDEIIEQATADAFLDVAEEANAGRLQCSGRTAVKPAPRTATQPAAKRVLKYEGLTQGSLEKSFPAFALEPHLGIGKSPSFYIPPPIPSSIGAWKIPTGGPKGVPVGPRPALAL